jgi:biofilm protein TabA
MIIDKLSNSNRYALLSPRIKQAFDYLHQAELDTISAGKYEIDGKNLYAMVQEYSTKPREAGHWEAHRKYIDLQCMVAGTEQVGFALIDRLEAGEYDPGKDFLPLKGKGDMVRLESGNFMLLFPEDAHMPGLVIDTPRPVKKVVVKIAIED